MPIVIKEVIVRTTVEKAVKETTVDEKLIRKIEQRIFNRIREEEPPKQRNHIKNR